MCLQFGLVEVGVAEIVWTVVKGVFTGEFAAGEQVPLQTVGWHPVLGVQGACDVVLGQVGHHLSFSLLALGLMP